METAACATGTKRSAATLVRTPDEERVVAHRLIDLPADLMASIIRYLVGHELLQLAATCRSLGIVGQSIFALSYHGQNLGRLLLQTPNLISVCWTLKEPTLASSFVALGKLSYLTTVVVKVDLPAQYADQALADSLPSSKDKLVAFPSLESLDITLLGAKGPAAFEALLSRTRFPALRSLSLTCKSPGQSVGVDWLLDLIARTGHRLTHLEVNLNGQDLPKLVAAIEAQGPGYAVLRQLHLHLSGVVPLMQVMELTGTARSRLLRLDGLRLHIDPQENDAFGDLLSPALWNGQDVHKQQVAALLLGEILITSFSLFVFLPADGVRAATSGALRLLLDPRLVLRKPLIVRFLGELLEESFNATFENIDAQAAALADVLKDCLESGEGGIMPLRVLNNLRQATRALNDDDPRALFVGRLAYRLMIAGGARLLLQLVAKGPWEQAYMAANCLAAIPVTVYRQVGCKDFTMEALKSFIDVGRSPVAHRMNDSFLTVLERIVSADRYLAHRIARDLGEELLLLLLNWPVVRLYLIESVGDAGRSHLAIMRRIFDLDPSLFPRFKALLLSDAPLPALTCELRTPPNAFLCPHHLPAPRGSLLCRFIMAVARLDKEIGGGVPNLPAAEAAAAGLNTVPGSAGRYMSCLFETPEDEILFGEMLLRDVPLGAELGLFYQEVSAAINLCARFSTLAKQRALEVWGADKCTAMVLNAISCVAMNCPTANNVIQDFLRFFTLDARLVFEYASSPHSESYSYYRCGRGQVPRRELVIKALASLLNRLGEEGSGWFLRMLLASPRGNELLGLVMLYLESGQCPQHEVMAMVGPLQGGIARLRQMIQNVTLATAPMGA